jgi:hypothetical protein
MAAASSGNSHRVPMGMDAYEVSPSAQLEGTLVQKKSTQAMDPTGGGKANRVNVEKVGATYRVSPKATFVQLDPAAGPTMASARIIPSVQGRVTPNFESEIQYSTN